MVNISEKQIQSYSGSHETYAYGPPKGSDTTSSLWLSTYGSGRRLTPSQIDENGHFWCLNCSTGGIGYKNYGYIYELDPDNRTRTAYRWETSWDWEDIVGDESTYMRGYMYKHGNYVEIALYWTTARTWDSVSIGGILVHLKYNLSTGTTTNVMRRELGAQEVADPPDYSYIYKGFTGNGPTAIIVGGPRARIITYGLTSQAFSDRTLVPEGKMAENSGYDWIASSTNGRDYFCTWLYNDPSQEIWVPGVCGLIPCNHFIEAHIMLLTAKVNEYGNVSVAGPRDVYTIDSDKFHTGTGNRIDWLHVKGTTYAPWDGARPANLESGDVYVPLVTTWQERNNTWPDHWAFYVTFVINPRSNIVVHYKEFIVGPGEPGVIDPYYLWHPQGNTIQICDKVDGRWGAPPLLVKSILAGDDPLTDDFYVSIVDARTWSQTGTIPQTWAETSLGTPGQMADSADNTWYAAYEPGVTQDTSRYVKGWTTHGQQVKSMYVNWYTSIFSHYSTWNIENNYVVEYDSNDMRLYKIDEPYLENVQPPLILKHTHIENEEQQAAPDALEKTSGVFEIIHYPNAASKVEISKGAPTVAYSIAPSGEVSLEFSASNIDTPGSFQYPTLAGELGIFDARVIDIVSPENYYLHSGQLEFTDFERFIMVGGEGGLYLIDYNLSTDWATMAIVPSGVTVSGITTSGIFNAIEATNYTYPNPFIFFSISGGNSFFQRNPDSFFWNDYSIGLPEANITIIRTDDAI